MVSRFNNAGIRRSGLKKTTDFAWLKIVMDIYQPSRSVLVEPRPQVVLCVAVATMFI